MNFYALRGLGVVGGGGSGISAVENRKQAPMVDNERGRVEVIKTDVTDEKSAAFEG